MFCNILQFGDATFSNSHLQLSVIIFYNKQVRVSQVILSFSLFSLAPRLELLYRCLLVIQSFFLFPYIVCSNFEIQQFSYRLICNSNFAPPRIF